MAFSLGNFVKDITQIHNDLHQHVFHRNKSGGLEAVPPRTGAPMDLTIKFIQASNLPRMDLGPGQSADPYFIASIDGKVSFVSSACSNTLSPIWNELWLLKNVPSDAILKVDVHDKDEGALNDDYIGSFSTDISSGMKVGTLKGFTQDRGSFGLNVTATPSHATNVPQYTFDGPVRYTQHFSPTLGALTNINNPNSSNLRLWSTWKISIKGVSLFFGNSHQHWNVNYKAAQTIFQGPLSIGVRAPIQAGHRLLYARTTSNVSGVIDGAEGFWELFMAVHDGPNRRFSTNTPAPASSPTQARVKPAVYTYIIGEDDTFRFSETGAQFFTDFASKHALHSCCAETVRYSGEFHPRPVMPDNLGWASFDDNTPDSAVRWELVIDNNSGTYGPDKTLLHSLKGLLEYNFPGLRVVVMDYKDNGEELTKSTTACREFAIKYRNVGDATTAKPDKTLAHMAIKETPHMVMEQKVKNVGAPGGI